MPTKAPPLAVGSSWLGLAALDQRGNGIAKRAVTRLAGRKVHADLDSRGRATLRSLTRAELPDADAAWSNAVRSVTVFAGHDPAASSDEAATVCASGMPQQKWHQDSAAALAYVVALSDGVEGTQDRTEHQGGERVVSQPHDVPVSRAHVKDVRQSLDKGAAVCSAVGALAGRLVGAAAVRIRYSACNIHTPTHRSSGIPIVI